MNQGTVLTEAKQAKLVADIRRLIEEGRARAGQAAKQEMVKTYWQVGERIDQEGLTENAGYGQAILEDLAEELGIDVSTLKRCVYFFQTYNSATSSTNLSWSHYKYLLSIHDDQERTWYEQAADKQDWNVLQLSHAIKENKYAKAKKSKGTKTSSPKLKRPTKATYVYKAYVDRVIDGDTLYLRIDLGFQVFKEQRVRLAQIDCEPIDTPKGREAYEYVRDKLARVPFVLVKTNKIDIYGRYIGDVFYSFTDKNKNKIFTSGRYLNQELVECGLARIL